MSSPALVTKTILINTSPSKIWKALTDNSLLQMWMSDGTLEISSDWELGSAVIIRGRANGTHEYKGVVLKHEPEKLLQYSSWADVSKLPDKPENYSLITFELNAKGDQTELTLTHSNLIAEAAYEHSNFYWNTALFALKKLVEQ